MELSQAERERIYAEEKAKKEAQERLEKEKKTKTSKQSCLGCLGVFIALLIFSTILNSCGSSKTEKPQNSQKPTSTASAPAKENKQKMSTKIAGQDTTINIDGLMATSEPSYDMLLKYLNANNKEAVARMMLRGEVVPVNKGDRATIIESGFASARVELVSGKSAGIRGWLPKEFID